MKKAKMAFLCCLCCMAIGTACARETFEMAGQVHPSLPMLTIRVTDTGERLSQQMRENVLSVSVQAQDGSLVQEFTYQSSMNPAAEQAAAMAMLRDLNFDGYQDLMLLTAAGARNVFHAVALWDVEAGQFRPVEQSCEWLREEERFANEVTQAELCNAELLPDKRMVVSEEQDGFRFRRQIFYMWDGSYTLSPKYIFDVYDAGDGVIGESLTSFASRVTFLWDEQYPEEWYYGQDGVADERRQAVREMALGGDSVRLQVANVDWVNLRRQDSKASPSLAKINAGEAVMLLVDECGPENGWVRVFYDPGEHHAISADKYEDGHFTMTGYIWHSFLEPHEP